MAGTTPEEDMNLWSDGDTSSAEIAELRIGKDGKPHGISIGQSLRNTGPKISQGSFGHPDECKPCQFYCFSWAGCQQGDSCNFCHLEHLKKQSSKSKSRKQNKLQQPNMASKTDDDDISQYYTGDSPHESEELHSGVSETTASHASPPGQDSTTAEMLPTSDSVTSGEEKQTLERNGPQHSAGSGLHPVQCVPCSFYCYSRSGCSQGSNCSYCHMEHLRIGRRHRRAAVRERKKQTENEYAEAYKEEGIFLPDRDSGGPLVAARSGVSRVSAAAEIPESLKLHQSVPFLAALSTLPFVQHHVTAQKGTEQLPSHGQAVRTSVGLPMKYAETQPLPLPYSLLHSSPVDGPPAPVVAASWKSVDGWRDHHRLDRAWDAGNCNLGAAIPPGLESWNSNKRCSQGFSGCGFSLKNARAVLEDMISKEMLPTDAVA